MMPMRENTMKSGSESAMPGTERVSMKPRKVADLPQKRKRAKA
jgi:hypothetical protein